MHDVLDSFAVAGYAPDPTVRDRADHVSFELAVMQGLWCRSESATAEGDEDAARRAAERAHAFFLARIDPWVPSFFESMARASRFALHSALARHATVFFQREGACVGRSSVESLREPTHPEAPCVRCGRPLGFSLPREGGPAPSWGSVCVRCRVRVDLRRLES
jgi:hypothetical protein